MHLLLRLGGIRCDTSRTSPAFYLSQPMRWVLSVGRFVILRGICLFRITTALHYQMSLWMCTEDSLKLESWRIIASSLWRWCQMPRYLEEWGWTGTLTKLSWAAWLLTLEVETWRSVSRGSREKKTSRRCRRHIPGHPSRPMHSKRQRRSEEGLPWRNEAGSHCKLRT